MAFLLSPSPRLQFIDENGDPYAGGFLYTYAVGTDTPQDTYADASGTPNDNPIELDMAGRATVYLGTAGYKFKLYDADLNLIFTQDNVFANFVTATGTVTLQNKTLDDSNVITVKDSNFTVEAAGATTSKFRFVAGAITAGQTRQISVPDSNLTLVGSDTQNVFTKRQEWGQGAAVSSANDMTLGLDGNTFLINGTTTINGIATANWTKGSVIILKFNGSLTVKNNTAPSAGFAKLLLQGNADWAVGAGDMLILVLENSGTAYWTEIARGYASTKNQDRFIQQVEITIANADIKNLDTVSVEAIAAPGADKIVQVIDATFILDAAAGAYTNVDAAAVMGLITSTVIGVSERVTDGFFTAASKKAVQVNGGSIDLDGAAYSDMANKAILVSVNNNSAGHFTGGNSANTLKVRITYQIRDFT